MDYFLNLSADSMQSISKSKLAFFGEINRPIYNSHGNAKDPE